MVFTKDFVKNEYINHSQYKTNEVINIFVSQKEAERQTGAYHSNIAKCCKGKAKYANGYKWKYAEDI